MQHDHVLKTLNFDLLTESQGGRGMLWGKNLLPHGCITGSLKFNMHHGHVLRSCSEKSEFSPFNPQSQEVGGGAKYLLPCC